MSGEENGAANVTPDSRSSSERNYDTFPRPSLLRRQAFQYNLFTQQDAADEERDRYKFVTEVISDAYDFTHKVGLNPHGDFEYGLIMRGLLLSTCPPSGDRLLLDEDFEHCQGSLRKSIWEALDINDEVTSDDVEGKDVAVREKELKAHCERLGTTSTVSEASYTTFPDEKIQKKLKRQLEIAEEVLQHTERELGWTLLCCYLTIFMKMLFVVLLVSSTPPGKLVRHVGRATVAQMLFIVASFVVLFFAILGATLKRLIAHFEFLWAEKLNPGTIIKCKYPYKIALIIIVALDFMIMPCIVLAAVNYLWVCRAQRFGLILLAVSITWLARAGDMFEEILQAADTMAIRRKLCINELKRDLSHATRPELRARIIAFYSVFCITAFLFALTIEKIAYAHSRHNKRKHWAFAPALRTAFRRGGFH